MRSLHRTRPPLAARALAARALRGLALASVIVAAACQSGGQSEREDEREPPAADAPEREPDRDAPPELDDAPQPDDEPALSRPIEELSEEELEAECFRGRREACDLLGH